MSALTQRALARPTGGSGFAQAKRLANLALKTNVDGKGKVTSKGYQAAIAQISPYVQSSNEAEATGAQILLADYNNNLVKIETTSKNQNETLGSFKLQEEEAYFSDDDSENGFRNIQKLAGGVSERLDTVIFELGEAIQEKQANNESVDTMLNYYNELVARGNSMRDLQNKFERGEISEGQMLDGYGYYVESSPFDGSVRRAAIIPVGNAPENLTKGYRRLDTSANLAGGMLPVYAPAQKTSDGQSISKIGKATFSGSGEGALTSDTSEKILENGNFTLTDRNTFPKENKALAKGEFLRGVAGLDEEGNPKESLYYRGQDGTIYNVDEQTAEGFKQDPILSQKLNGYIRRVSPTELKAQIQPIAKPFNAPVVQGEIRQAAKVGLAEEEAATAAAEAEKTGSFFGQAKSVVSDIRESIPAPVQSFFANAKNRMNKPDEAPTGGSAESIIDKGKSFFRKAKEVIS